MLLLQRNLLLLLRLLQLSKQLPQQRKLPRKRHPLINLWTRKRGDKQTETRSLVTFRIFRGLRVNRYLQH